MNFPHLHFAITTGGNAGHKAMKEYVRGAMQMHLVIQQQGNSGIKRMRMYLASIPIGRMYSSTFRAAEEAAKLPFELNVLCSFHYFKTGKSLLAIQEELGMKVNFFVDSGGFSAATLGVPIKLSEYIAWIRKNDHPGMVYANLDVIGDPEKSRRNLQILEMEGLTPIPVFHYGSDLKYLDEMREKYGYIALGGMVPILGDNKRSGNFCKQVFTRLKGYGTKVHGFGIGTAWKLARAFPWYSLDSSSWASVFQFRQLALFDEKRGAFAKIDLGTGSDDVLKHADLIRSYGVKTSDYHPGSKFDYVRAGTLSVLSVLRSQDYLRAYSEKVHADWWLDEK